MLILVVEPEKKPIAKEIDGSLESMQELVGGVIQAIYPFDKPIALIANDEGKYLGLPLNRALRDAETHEVYDIVAGTFFLCGAPNDTDNFASLTMEQIKRFSRFFSVPEMFLKVNGQLLILPIG